MSGTLTCADDNTSGAIEYDTYQVFVGRGECIWVDADNAGTGAADLLAVVVDQFGGMYGLASDYSQLDDEGSCTVPNWAGFDCPSASLTMFNSGFLTIGVAQWGGGCATGLSDYQLRVAIDGVNQNLTLDQNNVEVAALGLP